MSNLSNKNDDRKEKILTPPLNPYSPQEIASYQKLDLALRSHPELAREGATLLNPKALARLVQGIKFFQDTHLGRHATSRYVESKRWPMMKLPDEFFRMRNNDGPLFHLFVSAYRYKKDATWRQFDFQSKNRYSDNMALMKKIQQDLLADGHLKRPVVYFDDSVPKERRADYKAILKRFGGRIVKDIAGTGESAPTHVVAWDAEEHDSEVTLQGEEEAGDLIQKLFLKTLTIVDPKAKSKKSGGIIETTMQDSKKKGGKLKYGKGGPPIIFEHPMAFIHWWYHPSSYDEWMPAADVAGEDTDIPPRPPNGPWIVGCKFIRDVAHFNEWGIEADYAISDYQKKCTAYPALEEKLLAEAKAKEVTKPLKIRLSLSSVKSGKAKKEKTKTAEEEKTPEPVVELKKPKRKLKCPGMMPKQIFTGFYSDNNKRLKRTVYNGALRIASGATELVHDVIKDVKISALEGIDEQFKLPDMDEMLRPSLDPMLANNFLVTELHAGKNGTTLVTARRIPTMAVQPERIRGGGDGDVEMQDETKKLHDASALSAAGTAPVSTSQSSPAIPTANAVAISKNVQSPAPVAPLQIPVAVNTQIQQSGNNTVIAATQPAVTTTTQPIIGTTIASFKPAPLLVAPTQPLVVGVTPVRPPATSSDQLLQPTTGISNSIQSQPLATVAAPVPATATFIQQPVVNTSNIIQNQTTVVSTQQPVTAAANVIKNHTHQAPAPTGSARLPQPMMAPTQPLVVGETPGSAQLLQPTMGVSNSIQSQPLATVAAPVPATATFTQQPVVNTTNMIQNRTTVVSTQQPVAAAANVIKNHTHQAPSPIVPMQQSVIAAANIVQNRAPLLVGVVPILAHTNHVQYNAQQSVTPSQTHLAPAVMPLTPQIISKTMTTPVQPSPVTAPSIQFQPLYNYASGHTAHQTISTSLAGPVPSNTSSMPPASKSTTRAPPQAVLSKNDSAHQPPSNVPSTKQKTSASNSIKKGSVTPSAPPHSVPEKKPVGFEVSDVAAMKALPAKPEVETKPLSGDQEPTTDPPEWYDPNTVSNIEMLVLPEWFNNSACHRTKKSYIVARERIIDAARRSSHKYLTSTSIRRCVAGDAGSIMRLHQFLVTWGFINGGAIGDSAPLQVKTKTVSKPLVPPEVKWTSQMVIELGIAVEECCSKKMAIETDGDAKVHINWDKVAKKVGNNVTKVECYQKFLSTDFNDSKLNTGTVKIVDSSLSNIDNPHEDLISDLIDGVKPQVAETVVEAALNATGGDLNAAQKAGVLGVISSKAAERAQKEEEATSHLLQEILDLRMAKLENRLSLLDDLEGMLDAERMALELERRDLYTNRCRHWFNADS